MLEKVVLIHAYTRAEAIRDSVLIDVSATAKEAGLKYPVALTAATPQQRGYTLFKGIPLAAPPVGELRRKAPQPVRPCHRVTGPPACGLRNV
jgi:hypothetical protein